MELIEDEQNGFRKDRSCLDHIHALSSIIRNRINKKLPAFVAFVDFKKAFDYVDRYFMFYSLMQYNIDGKVYKSIKSLYTNTISCIRINAYCSPWFRVNSVG